MKSILFLLLLTSVYAIIASTGMILDTIEAGGKLFLLPITCLLTSIAAGACVWHMAMKVNERKGEQKICSTKSNKSPVIALLILAPFAIHSFIKVFINFEKGGVPLIYSVIYYLLVLLAVIGTIALGMKADKKQESMEASGE